MFVTISFAAFLMESNTVSLSNYRIWQMSLTWIFNVDINCPDRP